MVSLVDGIQVFPVENLAGLIGHLQGTTRVTPVEGNGYVPEPEPEPAPAMDGSDLTHIRGQEHAKRALEVAAAGFHNLLFNGPPGSGKTLLARSLPSILPRMSRQEALETTKIYSIAGGPARRHPLDFAETFSCSPLHYLQRWGKWLIVNVIYEGLFDHGSKLVGHDLGFPQSSNSRCVDAKVLEYRPAQSGQGFRW